MIDSKRTQVYSTYMDSVDMAKKRWKNFTPKQRSEEMSRVAKAGWKKRRKNKVKTKTDLT